MRKWKSIYNETPQGRRVIAIAEITTFETFENDKYMTIILEEKNDWKLFVDMIAEVCKSKEQKEKELREKAAYEKHWADDAVRRKVLWDATPRGVPYFPHYTPAEWQERIIKPHWFLRSGQVPGDVNVSPDGTWVSMDRPLNEPNY